MTAADIEPGKVYAIADVASVFGITEWSVRVWAKSGRLAPLPRLGPRDRYRFLGLTLLRLLGEEAKSLPAPHESRAEREARAKADWDRALRS